MSDVEITKASTRGQIVLPKSIRDEIGIESGDYFAVYSSGDTIFLKKIEKIKLKKMFKETSKKLRKQAKEKGITRKMVSEAIADVRKKKAKSSS